MVLPGLAAVALAWWFASRGAEPMPAPPTLSAAEPPCEPSPCERLVDPDASSPSALEADASSAPMRRSYNVVLITVDTLRFDLGYAGNPRPVTPNLDALAARSIVYERAYATASYTPKSIAPLVIGRYTSETYRDGEHFTTFYPRNVFVAERAREAGVRTFAAMTHHYFKWPTGLSEGFDVWDTSALPPEMKDNDSSVTSDRLTDVALELFSRAENVTPTRAPRDAGAAADADAVHAAEDEGGPTRFFAWFHYLDPHAAYVAHEGAPDFASMLDAGEPKLKALYEKDVWFTDKHVGRVLDAIASAEWGADTAIIVTSDHGEAFGEKGHYKHGREVWESLVRVPLIVHVPGVAPRRIALKRSHIDVAPTVVELLGLPPPEEGVMRGKSLLADVAAPEEELEERDVYIDMPEGPYNEARRALITGPSPGLKLIDFGGRFELYDLATDPGEARNITGDRERFSDAQARLRELRASLQEIPAPPPRPRLASE